MAKSIHRWYCKNRHTNVDENATFGGTITATSGTVTITTGAISVANITTLNTTGLASLDGGIDVDSAFTVADTIR